MKTTIDFPEHLLRKAKITAVQRNTTLKELVFRGLEHVIHHPESTPDSGTVGDQFLSALQARNTKPMVPLKRKEVYDR